MLQIKDLSVKIDNHKILDNFNIDIKPNTIHVIMGPNGVGKSTLSKVIMGDRNYEILSGSIIFNGEDISNLETYEIARRGIFLCFQNPAEIDGVSNNEMIRTAINSRLDKKIGIYDFIKQIEATSSEVKLTNEMLKRGVNVGFSGGEKKKNEVLQLKMLKPKLIILDEIDSGLDIDSLKVVGENIMDYYKNNDDVSILIITHYPRILNYLKPDYVHIMKQGNIAKTGDISLAYQLEEKGYDMISIIDGSGKNE